MKSRKSPYAWKEITPNILEAFPSGSFERYLTASYWSEQKSLFDKIKTPSKPFSSLLSKYGIENAAISRHKAPYYSEFKNKSFASVLITTSGEAKITSEGKLFRLKRGTLCYTPAGGHASARVDRVWNVIWFHLRNSEQWRTFLPANPFLDSAKRFECISNVAENFAAEIFSDSASLDIAANMANLLYSLLCGELRRSKAAEKVWRRLEAVLLKLQSEPNPAPTAGEISRDIGCSVYELNKYCLRTRAATYGKIVRNISMLHAASMLERGAGISETALKLGFSDRFSFTKSYKAFYGRTPAALDAGGFKMRRRPKRQA